MCCEAIKSLFKNEGKHGGEGTVRAVRLIAQLVKSRDCHLHPDSIYVCNNKLFIVLVQFLILLGEVMFNKVEVKCINMDSLNFPCNQLFCCYILYRFFCL